MGLRTSDRQQGMETDTQGPRGCVRGKSGMAQAPASEGAGKEKLPLWGRTRLFLMSPYL